MIISSLNFSNNLIYALFLKFRKPPDFGKPFKLKKGLSFNIYMYYSTFLRKIKSFSQFFPVFPIIPKSKNKKFTKVNKLLYFYPKYW